MERLPHSIETERAILGSILLNPGLFSEAIKLITPEEFYSLPHARIYRAMIALHERGAAIDPIVIAAELDGDLPTVGGMLALAELTEGLPAERTLAPYAEIVRERALARAGLKAADGIRARFANGGGTTETIQSAIEIFGELGARATVRDASALRITCMADVDPEELAWLWFPFIPLGKLTIIEGDPGVGKSWLTCALASAISLGRGLPGAELFGAANVVMLSAEDGLADTVRPRLDTAEADVSRIYALNEPLTLDAAGLLRLELCITQHAPVLVIMDPFFAFLGGKMDINRANECRNITARLAAIAEKQGCAIVAIRHLGKSHGLGHALNAGIGSIDITAAARSVLLVGADPDDPSCRALVQIKNNLAPFGDAVGYKIECSKFYWTGPTDLTAARILSVADADGAGVDAAAVLRDMLSDGAKPAKEAEKEMHAAGFTKDQTRRARERLHVRPQKKGFGKDASWVWELPRSEDGSVIEDGSEGGDMSELCHLRANHHDKSTYSNYLTEDGNDNELCHLRVNELPSSEPGDLVVGEV